MLEGLHVPLFTAFNRDHSVAYEKTQQHAKWLVENGVDGLIPFGTFGEGASLSLAEKLKLTEALLDISKGAKVIPTLICNSLGEVLEYLKTTESWPLSAVMVIPPSYFRPVKDESIQSYFEHVVAATRLPVVAYNIPATSLLISPDVAADLKVWGVKDSSGDIELANSYLKKGVKVLMGSDALLVEGMKLGAAGGICGLANFFPSQMKEVYEITRMGSLDAAESKLKRITAFSQAIVPENSTFGTAISLLKSAGRKVLSVDVGPTRLPLEELPVEESRLKNAMKIVTELS